MIMIMMLQLMPNFYLKIKNQESKFLNNRIIEPILDGFINCLKFFTEYQQKRREYILHNEDKFNIHSLSKKYIDSQDPYFIYVSNLLKDLLNLKKDTFNEICNSFRNSGFKKKLNS